MPSSAFGRSVSSGGPVAPANPWCRAEAEVGPGIGAWPVEVCCWPSRGRPAFGNVADRDRCQRAEDVTSQAPGSNSALSQVPATRCPADTKRSQMRTDSHSGFARKSGRHIPMPVSLGPAASALTRSASRLRPSDPGRGVGQPMGAQVGTGEPRQDQERHRERVPQGAPPACGHQGDDRSDSSDGCGYCVPGLAVSAFQAGHERSLPFARSPSPAPTNSKPQLSGITSSSFLCGKPLERSSSRIWHLYEDEAE